MTRTHRATLAAVAIALVSACAAPHTEPRIDRLACNTCHAPLYSAEHEASGKSRECYQCHGTTNWGDAVLNHGASFRIDRGHHAGWDCGDCHQPGVSRDGTAGITCTNCHAHTAERTSPLHLGMGEYSYGPSTCLECHGGDGEHGDD